MHHMSKCFACLRINQSPAWVASFLGQLFRSSPDVSAHDARLHRLAPTPDTIVRTLESVKRLLHHRLWEAKLMDDAILLDGDNIDSGAILQYPMVPRVQHLKEMLTNKVVCKHARSAC